MAREIHEREDLLRDARALIPRALLTVTLAGQAVDVFAGFRGEALSIYFGEDPAYHFNAAGELRRAYVAERLIKAERGRLVAMERQRSDVEVSLVRHELDEAAVRQLLEDLAHRIGVLHTALAAGAFVVKGQEPPTGDAAQRLQAWLAKQRCVAIAESPRVGD